MPVHVGDDLGEAERFLVRAELLGRSALAEILGHATARSGSPAPQKRLGIARVIPSTVSLKEFPVWARPINNFFFFFLFRFSSFLFFLFSYSAFFIFV